MKILIISRNTFPQQGPRAFRTAELSEQLSKMGHDVTLYVVKSNYDYSAYEKETGVKIKFINNIFATANSNGTGRHNFIDKVLFHSLHGILEFPDIEFLFSIPRVLKKEYNSDLVISIAYPHTIHWGVARAKKKLGKLFPKCWIADCGDPYMLNPFINPPKYLKRFEMEWCSMTNYITVPTGDSFKGYYPEFHNKIQIIPQGFDFSKTPIATYSKNEIPTFVYAGTIYDGKRDPYKFMDYLSTLNYDFRFVVYTRSELRNEYKKLLGDKLILINDKNRKDIIYESSKADFLINILNVNSIQSPSKLIDYYISKRPVLNISTDFKESEDFNNFIKGDYSSRVIIRNGEDYKIENIANKFVKLVE